MVKGGLHVAQKWTPSSITSTSSMLLKLFVSGAHSSPLATSERGSLVFSFSSYLGGCLGTQRGFLVQLLFQVVPHDGERQRGFVCRSFHHLQFTKQERHHRAKVGLGTRAISVSRSIGQAVCLSSGHMQLSDANDWTVLRYMRSREYCNTRNIVLVYRHRPEQFPYWKGGLIAGLHAYIHVPGNMWFTTVQH